MDGRLPRLPCGAGKCAARTPAYASVRPPHVRVGTPRSGYGGYVA
jgi:hypothetical protein